MTNLRVRRFSTDLYLPHERHEAWANRHWPSVSTLLETTPDGHFNAFSQQIDLGITTIFYGAYSGQTARRTAKCARADGVDHLAIGLNLAGRILGPAYDVPVGGFALVDLSQEAEHHASECRMITLTLPRQALLAKGIDPRAVHGVTVDSGRAALLRSHLIQIRRSAPHIAESDATTLANTIVDLLAISVHDNGNLIGLSDEIAEHGDRAKALALIDRHIGNGALTIDVLCQRLRMSRSSLYRMFEEAGGVQTYIRDRRLDLAQVALVDMPDEAISDVADRLGFNDAAHFSRTFRHRFGLSPRDFRARETDMLRY